MHQAVLVHAQVDEGAELGHVAHRAFEHHALLEVGNVFHALVEARHLEVGARVAAGFFEFGQDVLHRHGAELRRGEGFGLERLEQFAAAHELVDGFAGLHDDLLHHRVGLGVHAGHVQRVVAAANAQKARALLEGLGAEAADFQQLLAASERAVRFAPAHHGLGHGARQARHARQQGRAGGVQIDTDTVHAVLDHGVELARQFALVHVVLVLADADALGVDLHQLGQRVLQAARDAGGAAQTHIHVGQFLAGVFAGRIDRGAGFADDYLFNSWWRLFCKRCSLFLHQFDQVARELVGLAAGGAVANGDELHTVFGHQLGQRVQAAVPVLARLVRVDGGGVDQLAGGINHGHLHAGADAGVEPHDGLGAGGRGQQQVAQVVAEDLDGHLLGIFAQACEQVALGAQAELHAPGPRHALAQQVVGRAALVAPAQVQGDAAFGEAGGWAFGRRRHTLTPALSRTRERERVRSASAGDSLAPLGRGLG